GLLLVSLIAAIVAFATPTRVPSHRNVAFAQRGAFAYTASTAVGPVYPTGAASTGDPLFTSLVHRARVSFHYKLSSLTASLVSGKIRLDAELSSTSGWRRSWVLAKPRAFRGNDATVSAPLDVAALEALLNNVASATGSPFQTYTLTVRPHVTA